jgi:hypothetical protein
MPAKNEKPKKPTASEREALKLAYLEEHLKYEHDMLGYTFRRVHELTSGPEWNAAFESFCVHARNLENFFRHSDEIDASEFDPGHKKPDHLRVFERLNAFLFHQSRRRGWQPKLNLADVQQMGAWLDREWARFVSGLSAPYAGRLDPAPVCSTSAVTLAMGVSVLSACSTVDAVTFSSASSTTQTTTVGKNIIIKTS